MYEDNIVAIATAHGASGVAVIRISGKSPLDIASKMFKPLKKMNFSGCQESPRIAIGSTS